MIRAGIAYVVCICAAVVAGVIEGADSGFERIEAVQPVVLFTLDAVVAFALAGLMVQVAEEWES